MNAPAGIKRSEMSVRQDDIVPGVARSPKLADYELIVRHHCPCCPEDQLPLRCALLKARDLAQARLRSASDEAAGMWLQIQRLGTLYAFAPISVDELSRLRATMLRMTACATDLETFACQVAGGPGARG